jgi:hypothetical protein
MRIDVIEEELEGGPFRRHSLFFREPIAELGRLLIEGSLIADVIGISELCIRSYDQMDFAGPHGL